MGVTDSDMLTLEFFKVPFEDALELVKARKCYLTQGVAYVQRNDMLSISVGIFRARLSAFLTMTSKALPDLEEGIFIK